MKLKNTRTAGIVLVVVAGLLALLYLGGLLCQVRLHYVQWLAAGGITGKAEITPIKMGVLACWQKGLSPTGLKCCLLVVLLLAGGWLFFTLYSRFGSKDRDERNFSRSDRGTYGTAGWMDDKELRAVLEVANPAKARGIILGKRENGDLICLPEDTRLNKHIAVFGASGTMKSRGVIRPALFQSIRRGESVVVTDPKSGATRS